MGKEYSAELRNAVLNRYRSGDPVISIADSLGIARSTIYSWINQSIVESRRIEISQYNYRLLEKKVARLEQIIEVITKANAHNKYRTPAQAESDYYSEHAD